LGIFDVSGRLIRRLSMQPLGIGEGYFRWDGLDRRGKRVAPGVYFARTHPPARADGAVRQLLVVR
jgi:hypothetical protein